jgi:hypothetical protein
MNEDFELIKVDLSVFQNSYKNYSNESKPEHLINKLNILLENYSCFSSNYNAKSLWEKKKIIASNKVKTRNRPHIISFDFTNEAKCKKEFTSYLNKLTDINKQLIYSKIKVFIDSIKDENLINILFDILWNFIKISSNNIYIDVLYLFESKIVIKSINKYWDHFELLPPENFMEKNNSFDTNYDLFCDYVKWKKGNLSISRALCIIFKKENLINNISETIDKIINLINDFITKNDSNKYIIDLLLDELSIFIDATPNNIYIKKITDFNVEKLVSSSKFKIYNIIEKYK